MCERVCAGVCVVCGVVCVCVCSWDSRQCPLQRGVLHRDVTLFVDVHTHTIQGYGPRTPQSSVDGQLQDIHTHVQMH